MDLCRRDALSLMALLLGGSCLSSPALSWSERAAVPDPESLSDAFLRPPASARPRVWWHWMNGNITKDGIRKDMEWMHRVGIAGLTCFDAAGLTPSVVPQRLAYMAPGWKDAFGYAARLADQLGLELGVSSSPGWSETGGPWVRPADAMKKLVWSETIIEGGRRFNAQLPEPPQVTGPFQDARQAPDLLMPADPNAPTYYGEAAVVAYRVREDQLPAPRISFGVGKEVNGALLSDGSATTGVDLDFGRDNQPSHLLFEYGSPVTIRAATIATALGDRALVRPFLEAQDAVRGWRRIAEFELAAAPQTTISFPAVTARRFRFVFLPVPPLSLLAFASGAPGAVTDILPTPPQKPAFRLTSARLESEPRVNQFELKAGFAIAPDYYELDDTSPEDQGPEPGSVVDLTNRMTSDGRLDWTPPRGRWKILRFGYSLLGTLNHPATKEATGLEVDKYDRAAVRRYMEAYLQTISSAAGPGLIGAHGVRALTVDSTEVGPSNWTPTLLSQFRALRGYDARPWLPCLTGAVIGSTRQSNAFLYDFRRTLGDLMASEHYGTIAKIAHERGLLLYGESLEASRPVLGDDMTMRRFADVPMAALWSYSEAKGPNPGYIGDMKGAASVAHVYGQNLVAAESMTSAFQPWAYAPHDLRKFIDLEFACGVNRPVIHTSVHQPLDKPPGLSLLIFGQYFTRLETWAEMAGPWVDYIGRNAFMLQQGHDVADVAYFVGEERPVGTLFADGSLGDLPKSYAYDLVSADMIHEQLNVAGGELATLGGARYRILYLGGTSARMTLPVLSRLSELANGGATIVGHRPDASPSLGDDSAEFTELANRLWHGGAVTRIGRGTILALSDPELALKQLGVLPDVAFEGAGRDSQILFVHRKFPEGDAYFLNNRRDRPEQVSARFRVSGRQPELWRADTGHSEPVSFRIEDGQTIIPLTMDPYDSFFIVFRKPALSHAASVAPVSWSPVTRIGGPWSVSFQPDRGAPPSTRLAQLAPLNENPDPAIKYFSGVATYRTSFRLEPGDAARTLVLDLGRVGDIAEVLVNGKPVGTAWKLPFRVDVSGAVMPGQNSLEVRVANLWVNRLIGDAQPGAAKITFTTLPTYRADAPLRMSGLVGPVQLLSKE